MPTRPHHVPEHTEGGVIRENERQAASETERIARLEHAVGEILGDIHGVAGADGLARSGTHPSSAQLLAIHERRLEAAGIAPKTGLPDPPRDMKLPPLPRA
jgi:aminoglycoside phosphotransferase (APT) family kinase protein